ncbi:MAG TPA: ergothioneine biosynthesis protein EgtB [Pyrinomonadaceae bacterium]|nr:ergothioneine biosynthesis protein EgtB [Pyrinomonadaceae bacterium]
MQGTHPQTVKANSLAELYSTVRSYTEKLCAPLEIEDYIPQPSVDVSPPKWNIAHTTWFFEEMILKKFVPDYQVFDPNFGFLFNSYYNSVGERTARGHRGDLSRPTVKHVFEYRKHVDDRMLALLSLVPAVAGGSIMAASNPPATAGGTDNFLSDLVILGLNHEQQHQELFLADLKYTFSLNPLFPVYSEEFILVDKKTGGDGSTSVDAGLYEIGFTGEGFCFDNELARHQVYLDAFEIRNTPVTNGEYIGFIEDGAYRDFRLWHSEGWDWVNQNKIDSPLYWLQRDGEWMNYTLGGLKPVELEAPVCHVSYYEASAFAEWSGTRLPTEFEWEAASGKFDWGLRWEWTNSAYLPYPGFSKAEGAVGEYNAKFMINQMVLRGASVATPAGHSRNTYRNFFHPHLRWQFTGIRLAR